MALAVLRWRCQQRLRKPSLVLWLAVLTWRKNQFDVVKANKSVSASRLRGPCSKNYIRDMSKLFGEKPAARCICQRWQAFGDFRSG